jgi:hypothetical protein
VGAFDEQIDNRVNDDNQHLTEWLRSRRHPSETILAVCRAGEVASVNYRTYILGLTSARLICQPTDRRGRALGRARTVYPADVADTSVWTSGSTRRALLAGTENQVRVTLTTGQPFRFVPLHGVSFEENLAADPQLAVVWSFVDWLMRAEGAAVRANQDDLAV